jgi:tRNA threonylcarbamoyl adenosine modification protein YeaZ
MLERIYSISVETITKNGSISIQKNGTTVFFCELTTDESLSKSLIERISTILNENELTKANLTFLATATGPGSFTSIRVAISTLSGIARSLNIPLIGVDFPDLIEHFDYDKSDAICILAGKTQIIFTNGNKEIETIDLSELKARSVDYSETIFRLDKKLLEIICLEHETVPKNITLLLDICETIGKIAYRKFQEGNLTPAIPQYLEFYNGM